MADDQFIVWTTCDHQDCIGVQVGRFAWCLAHLAEQEPSTFDEELRRIGAEGAIDGRGVRFSTELLKRVLDIAPRKDGRPFLSVARFEDAILPDAADFGRAIFQDRAWFAGATFLGTARFDRATFQHEAWFAETIFQGGASFIGATFRRDAWFTGATFSHDAEYHEASFEGLAEFSETAFRREARFGRAVFQGKTGFDSATVERTARFDEVTFERARVWADGRQATQLRRRGVQPASED
jgi:uncharacterized protein YjbI with pentapeptide repeats